MKNLYHITIRETNKELYETHYDHEFEVENESRVQAIKKSFEKAKEHPHFQRSRFDFNHLVQLFWLVCKGSFGVKVIRSDDDEAPGGDEWLGFQTVSDAEKAAEEIAQGNYQKEPDLKLLEISDFYSSSL